MKNVPLKICTCISLLLVTMFIACATPGERIAQKNSKWASLLVGEHVFVNSEGKAIGKLDLEGNGYARSLPPKDDLFPEDTRCFNAEWRFEEPAKIIITCRGYSDEPLHESALEIRSFTRADASACISCSRTPDQFVMLTGPKGRTFIVTSKEALDAVRKANLPSADAMRNQWNSVDRTKCKSISDFQEAVPNDYKDLKTSVGNAFAACIDSKVLNYFKKTYPRLAQHGDQPIYFADGTRSEAKLAELFDGMVLGRNPDSGFKIDPKDFRIEILTNDSFQLIMNVEGKNMQFDFKIFNGKVNVVGLSAGWEKNPRGWEMAAESAFQMFYKYPANGYWDWPYIDSL